MKLFSVNLSTRITLAALLLVMGVGLLWMLSRQQYLHETYLSERSADLEIALNVENLRLSKTIDELRHDALFLANVPPISGMVRARANHGFDARDKNSFTTWDTRLQEIFIAFLRAHPDYSRARYISVEQGGKDLVAVGNLDGQVRALQLQTKINQPYFKQVSALHVGQVYLSEFNLERESGNFIKPNRPTLRAVTPVFDANGRLFGMIVLNLDVRPLLAAAVAILPAGVQGYVADQYGHYLFHPDAQRAFTFELGSKEKIGDDFYNLKSLLESSTLNALPLSAMKNSDGYVAAQRVFFDAGDPARFLLLAYHLPSSVVSEQIYSLTSTDIINAVFLMLLAGAFFMFMLRRSFSPLARITTAAHEIAAGNQQLRITESSGGEIGELSSALNVMLDKLSDHEMLKHERDFRKCFIDSTQDGYWLTDVAGNILEVNQAYADMSGYSVEELVGMHISQLEAQEKSKDEVMVHIAKIIAQRSDLFETRHRHKDGHEIDIELSTTFVRETQQFVVFSHDITKRKRIAQALSESEIRWKFAIEGSGDGVWDWNIQTDETLFSKRWREMLGYAEEDILPTGEELKHCFHPDDQHYVAASMQAYLEGKANIYAVECRMRRKDGSYIWVLGRGMVVVRSDDGRPLRMIGTSSDITARKRAEEKLRIAAVAFETHEAIMITDVNGNIIRVNQAFQDITGYNAEEVLGKNPRILSSGRQDRQFYMDMWQQLLSIGTWSGEIWDKRKSGQIYPKWLTITAVKEEPEKTNGYVAIFSDITARKVAEDEIRNLAFYDPLTRLPNRRLLLDRLRLALSVSARSQNYGALLFLDMDRFKTLNDTLGHDYGDMLLVEVAARIQVCVREVDSVARLGGDEFVVLLEEIDKEAEDASQTAALVAEKIRVALSVPYQLSGHEHHSSPSIGVCLYRGNDESVDELLKHADMAMYQAKDSGRNTVRFFDPAMQLAVETRAALEADLRHAVSGQQLHLYYQIQVDSAHRPIGAEALVRWIHPTRGIVSPAEFIPIAEESSQILDIGGWVLDTACRQLGVWAKSELTRNLTLAVNVSAPQFRQHDFVEGVAAVLRTHEVNASHLKLELTESVVLNDVADVIAKMHALKALGIKLSMDDFGTGYSSLSYLKQLPLDQIKIDQSFVRDITNDPNDAMMVRTIIDMAINFGLNVIAEGVETEAQLAFLNESGCMAYQGYFFSKPVPIEAFSKLIEQH